MQCMWRACDKDWLISHDMSTRDWIHHWPVFTQAELSTLQATSCLLSFQVNSAMIVWPRTQCRSQRAVHSWLHASCIFLTSQGKRKDVHCAPDPNKICRSLNSIAQRKTIPFKSHVLPMCIMSFTAASAVWFPQIKLLLSLSRT